MQCSYLNFINVIKHYTGCYEFVKSFSLIPSVISVSFDSHNSPYGAALKAVYLPSVG